MLTTKLLPFFVAALLHLSAQAAPDEITIGFNPAENADVVETNGKLFAEYYKKKTGLRVKTFVSSDYTALVEAMRSGRVDFAFLPPFSLVKAEEIAGAKVLLKAVRRGRAVYYSALIVRSDRGLQKIQDLKGKNIAWVDPSSATGFIIPKAAMISKYKLDPDEFFAKQVFAGSHDALVLAVLNGTVDAGATFVNDTKGEDGAWHLFLKSKEDRNKIKMIFVSDPIPGDTLATTNKFATEHSAIVKQAVDTLLDMSKNEEGKKILTALYRIDSMVPATSKDFAIVRDAARLVHIDLK